MSSGWEQLHLISIRTHAIIPPEEGEKERDRMWEQEEERKKRIKEQLSCGKRETENKCSWEWVERAVAEFTLPMLDTSGHVKGIMMQFLFDISKNFITIKLIKRLIHFDDSLKFRS